MHQSPRFTTYVGGLLDGARSTCRRIVKEELAACANDSTTMYRSLLWPAMRRIDDLYRTDRINLATEHRATRINRSIADQLQSYLPQMPTNGKSIIIACADGEPEELGAQMLADLFEARGWDVCFLGGGVPNDEILSLVGEQRPNVLLVFGTQPVGVRRCALADLIRSVGSNPTMNIIVSGGVFNRAEGLWKEVRADHYASDVEETIHLAETAAPRKAEVVIPGAPKKRRRRKRPPLLVTAEAS